MVNHNTSTTYDYTQGVLPTSTTDMNGQTTGLGYAYDSNGNRTSRVALPGEVNNYTSQSSTNSQCTSSSTMPCYEMDSNSSVYPNAIKRTFYDSLGRAAETRTPLDAGHDLIAYTVYDDADNKTFQSVPFRVPNGSSWVDPASAQDENGQTPAGSITIVDPLGRTMAQADPSVGSSAEPGISYNGLSGTWTTCYVSSYGYAYGDSTIYKYVQTNDANNHMTATFSDMLGRTRYSFRFSQAGSVGNNFTTKQEVQYNVLNEPTAVIVTDEAPQSGQSITSVTTSSTYDDLGRLTSVSDPDRGTHTLSYDADGRLLTDVSGTHTVGTSYDLLGRVHCVQDAAPTTDGSGNCSSGSHPLQQNTYGQSFLGTPGSTDFPTGRLTQTVSTTYYPDGTSVAETQQFQHDLRRHVVTANLQLSVPSSWNVTHTLPTYQMTQAYNDAEQPTTTQTMVGGNPGYTYSEAYDSTTGMLNGLSNNSIATPNLVTQSYDLHGLASDFTFLSTTGTALVNDHFSYDGNLRPASSTATWQAGSGSTGTVFSSNRTYDPVGNVISTSTTLAPVPGQSNSGGSETQNFCYDEENRLVWAGNNGTQPSAGNGTCGSGTLSSGLSGAGYNNSYAYTHLGQLWQGPVNGAGNTQQYLYCDSTHPHQLTGIYPLGTTCGNPTGASYSAGYDAWGNENARSYNSQTATLSYDVLDELVQWNAGSNSQEWYAYDPSGERVIKRSSTGSGTSLTVYAFGLEEHVYDGSGNSTGNTYYYSLAGRLIGKSDGTNTQFFLTDALGSVMTTFTAVANSATIVGNQAYGPYGNKRYKAGSMGTTRGFTGQYEDVTGLDYFNARYYDPVSARFVSADVAQGNTAGMDPYDYVGGNPETITDPSGQDWWNSFTSGVSNTFNGVTHAVSNAVHTVVNNAGNIATTVLDMTTGIPSMIKDVGTLFDGSKSWQEKLFAAGDLVFNVAMDASMLTGVGEVMAGARIVADIGEHAAVDTIEHAATDTVEHAVSDTVEHTVTTTVEHTVEKGSEHAASDVTAHAFSDVSEHASSDTTEHAAEHTAACSFTPTTPVTTNQGQQAIGDVHVGDTVLAYNPQTKKMELEPIVHVWVHTDDDLVDLTITSTTPAKTSTDQKGTTKDQAATTQTSEVIHTNQKHPFFTTEQGFVKVAELHVGMHVLKADGSVGVITGWKMVAGAKVMYNLEVAQDHTFTVGEGEWVVHNCTPGDKLPTRTDPHGKTNGVLVTSNGEEFDLESGRKGPAAQMSKDTPGFRRTGADHVESHAAALMRQRNMKEATLYINNTPCGDKLGCDAMLPHMLPEGAKLSVYFKDPLQGVNDWTLREYTGLPDSVWKPPFGQ